MVDDLSVFKSDEGKSDYLAAYDRTLDTWPVPYESRFIETRYADTHVLISGPEDGEPLVLMHGKGGSATMWVSNIVGLSCDYRVYCIDMLGDVGKTTTKEFFTDRAGFAEWLTEVLDGLGIDKANMMGLSMGSYLTACYALERPDRLKKIVLLAPAATFSPFSRGFTLKAILSNVIGSDYFIRKFLLAMSSTDSYFDGEMMSQMVLGLRYDRFSMKWGLPEIMPDEELAAIAVPTLLMVGEKESVSRLAPTRVIERAEKLVPGIQTRLVPDAVHMLNEEAPAMVENVVLAFLAQDE